MKDSIDFLNLSYKLRMETVRRVSPASLNVLIVDLELYLQKEFSINIYSTSALAHIVAPPPNGQTGFPHSLPDLQ